MINDDSFQEPDYGSESTFRSNVAGLFNNFSGASGTITQISQGFGLSCNPNPIVTTGTIFLNAEINNLNDVLISNPQTNQSLIYNGTSWVNLASSGGISLSFTSLTDTPNTFSGSDNNLVSVNSQGTSLNFITNNYINDVVAGNGIEVIQSTNSARILFDSSSLLENFSSNDNDKFVIEVDDENKRIMQKNINISGFNNDSNYLNPNEISSTTPITITNNGSSINIGLSFGELNDVDFNNGVSGILGIENGGTSAGTSELARKYLGLEYNIDILSQNGPSFDNTLYGDNILLQPSSFSLSIGTSGSGYSTGSVLLGYENFDTIGISITSITGSGGISTFEVNSGGISFFGRGYYPDTIETWSVIGGGGTGSSFIVIPEINYLNFGSSFHGSHSIGFRNNLGTIELKSKEGSCWQSIFPMTVNKIDDLIESGVSSGDLFVFNGTSWQNREINGFITIDSNGITNYNGGVGGISTSSIESNGISITPEEFSTLSGMCSLQGNIQTQIDSKVGTSIATVLGDMIYYNTTLGWQPISIGTSGSILNSGDGTSIPQYDYLRNILNTTSTPGICSALIETCVMGVSGRDLSVPMHSILNEFTQGTENGIDISGDNSQLVLNINNLPTGTSLSTNNELVFYDNSTKNITLNNFCNSITGSGLCTTLGTINIADPLPLGVYTFGTSPSGNIGNLAYFTDGDNGNPCLGVHNGVCWRVIQLGNPISS